MLNYWHVAVVTTFAMAAPAAAVVIPGDTGGAATFNRPIAGAPPTSLSTVGTAVRFQATPFTVTANGNYSFNNSSSYDNFLGLYAGSFNPAAPLTNALIYNDDSGPGSNAFFSFGLTTGTAYFAVATGFNNSDFGAYSLDISGPGTVVLGTIRGDTTSGSTFNRPIAGVPPTSLSNVGTAVRFQATLFTVSANGSYDFLNTSAYDNFLGLYAGSFNPAAPLTNALVYNDDSGPGSNAFFSSSLTAGTSYFAVSTGFANSDFGVFTLDITGPGTVFVGGGGVVPEPASWAMLIAGFGLVGATMRRRRMANVAA